VRFKVRRDIARLIGATLCAYLLVLQAVAGGLAMAAHAASAADPLSIRCLNSEPSADPEGVDDKRAMFSRAALRARRDAVRVRPGPDSTAGARRNRGAAARGFADAGQTTSRTTYHRLILTLSG
jgi:hypothetical protein